MESDDVNCILFRGQGIFQKSIPHNSESNVLIMHTAASALAYRAFSTTFEAMQASFFCREHVLQVYGLHRRNGAPNERDFVAEENVNFNGNNKTKGTIKTSNVSSLSMGHVNDKGQTRIQALHLAADDNQAELMR